MKLFRAVYIRPHYSKQSLIIESDLKTFACAYTFILVNSLQTTDKLKSRMS